MSRMETKKKKSKSPQKRAPPRPKVDTNQVEDRLLHLRDENHFLKSRKTELEEEVRL